MADAEILIQFAPKGDDNVLDAIKKVSKYVGDLKKIAKTPIDLSVVKNSMKPEDFNRLKATIENAKNATTDWGKEAEKAGKQAERAAAAAERAMARKIAAEEKAQARAVAAAEKAASREQALSDRLAAKAERDAARKAAAAERAYNRAAAAAERAAAREARANPTITNGGLQFTGSMAGGGRGGGGYPLGNPMAAPDPRSFSTKSIDELNRSLGRVPAKAKAAAEGLGFFGRIIAAMAIRSFIREIYEMANAWTAFENKIKTVLTRQEDLAFVTKDLIAISQRTRTSLEAVGSIYTRTARAVTSLGKSQSDTAKFTETLSKAVAVGGATSVEAQNAMIQLSQGLSSGALKGDELRSVLEQLPIVAQLIAQKLGVTTGALRKLGSEGKLTTEVVFDAILEATPKIDAQFAKMKPTMASVVQVLKDKFMVAIGQSSGLIDAATKALQYLSENFETAFKAIQGFAGAMSALGAGKILSMLVSIGTGWGGVAAAIVAATTAYSAFSDKVAASEDGMIKVVNVQHAWAEALKKDLTELGSLLGDTASALSRVLSLFTADVKYSHSWDLMYERLAKIADVLRTMANPEAIVGDLLGNKDAKEYTHRYQNALKRERALAIGAEKDAVWTKQKETEARWNAMTRGMMPEDMSTTSAAPAKKGGGKEHGKTFDELIKEALFDEQNSKWTETEQKIRDRLHGMIEKLKPSIKAALEDVDSKIAAVNKNFELEYSKFYSKFGDLNPYKEKQMKDARDKQIAGLKAQREEYQKQADTLEDIVRQEATREFYAKQRLEQEKESEKLLEDRIKEQEKFEQFQKELIEATADRQSARFSKFEGIAGQISPNYGIQQQVKELEQFRDFAKANQLADWAKLATQRIEELKASMRWENSHFETFADQMKSIFGPGGTLVKGFADAAANAIVMSKGLGDLKRALVDVLTSVQTQALSSLIQLPMNLAIGALTNSLTGGSGPTSLSGGSNGVRMLSAAEVSSPSQPPGLFGEYASGGYTGNYGVNEPAGIVHGQEFVLNAEATRRMGRQNLEMINAGATPTASSSAPVINIHNNAGVQVEAQAVSPGQIEVMITKQIQAHAPRLVASQMNDPNSIVSRSMQKNFSTDKRRI